MQLRQSKVTSGRNRPTADNFAAHRSVALQSQIGLLWLVGLVLSLAHERPVLILTTTDRLNPRLFDVMVVLGLFVVGATKPLPNFLPRAFRIWAGLVSVFCLCAFVYSVFLLPEEYGYYSTYFALKYLEGLLAIYLALKVPLSKEGKDLVHKALVAGGIYVAVYCIYEYFTSVEGREIEIAPGKFVRYYGNVLTGPLGYNYFHLAQFSSLCAVATFAFMDKAHTMRKRLQVLALTCFVAWPLFFSGSRTGLGLLVVGLLASFLLVRNAKSTFIVGALAVGLVLMIVDLPEKLNVFEQSSTLNRLQGSEGTANSSSARLLLMFDVDWGAYVWSYLIPIIGAGFYVAPVLTGSAPVYRVDYGVHNAYLFPLEQGGLVAATLFLVFLTTVMLALKNTRTRTDGPDRRFASALLAYLLACLPAFLAGQIFWLGFGNNNFNTLIVLLIMLGVRVSPRGPAGGSDISCANASLPASAS